MKPAQGFRGKTLAKKRSQIRGPILIKDDEHGLPYSKGLMASAIMATGLVPSQAYDVAKKIEDHLIATRKQSVSVRELRRVTLQILRNSFGDAYADKFAQWQALTSLEKPLVILIGGTTGVGKSTVAGEIAHRLGITRFISTDAIREVMRSIFSKDLMPALYDSSFDAWRELRLPWTEGGDPVIAGFREQTAPVSVGVRAMIERAIKEGTNQIIEGVHLAPGFIDFSAFDDDAVIISLVISVADEDLHRSHFYIRELETEGSRPFERYRTHFDSIRKIGSYIESLAQAQNIPVIDSENLDSTVSVVLEEIIARAARHVPNEVKTKRTGQADVDVSSALGELIGEEH